MKVALVAPIDARIRAVAGHQRERVGRDQLLTAGVTPSAITRRLRSGRLTLVHRGVYALPGTLELPFAAEAAALLAGGQDAVLSHHSAATLWGLRPGTARPVHVTLTAKTGCARLAGVKLHRSRTLTARDIRIHEGLPVTSPARTMLDVAAGLLDRDVELLFDDGLFARRLFTLAEIEDVIARAGGHPGRARLARVIAGHTRSTQTDSPPEEAMLGLIRAAGLPEPVLRVPMLGYRIDFLWPDLSLALEVDAYGTHGSPRRFEADRRRDARLLTEKGIVVIRLTRVAIEERAIEAVAVLARAIGQREAGRQRA